MLLMLCNKRTLSFVSMVAEIGTGWNYLSGWPLAFAHTSIIKENCFCGNTLCEKLSVKVCCCCFFGGRVLFYQRIFPDAYSIFLFR